MVWRRILIVDLRERENAQEIEREGMYNIQEDS
jgi:hypothetical protein